MACLCVETHSLKAYDSAIRYATSPLTHSLHLRLFRFVSEDCRPGDVEHSHTIFREQGFVEPYGEGFRSHTCFHVYVVRGFRLHVFPCL